MKKCSKCGERESALGVSLADYERAAANRQAFVASGGKRLASDRRSYLKRKYGMTIEQYDAMLEAQGGRCFICGRPAPGGHLSPRGHDIRPARSGVYVLLLQQRPGLFQEVPELLKKAASYVSWHANQEEIQLARRRALSLVGKGL